MSSNGILHTVVVFDQAMGILGGREVKRILWSEFVSKALDECMSLRYTIKNRPS